MHKVFIVGATGYIGKNLLIHACKSFPTSGTSSHYKDKYIFLDLRLPNNFPYDEVMSEGDIFVITAGISSPDVCKNDYQYAWDVNVSGTKSFIANVINRGGRVIFFSSDAVYGQKDKAFNENSTLNPEGEYAKMKHEVELTFKETKFFKSLRLSYVFSNEDHFTKYLMVCMKRNEYAELFHPFYRAIIYRGDVINGVIALAKRWDEFTQSAINFGGPEVLSRVEFNEIFNKTIKGNLRSRIIKPPPPFFLNRPKIIAMQSPILKNLLGYSPKTLEEAMALEFTKN